MMRKGWCRDRDRKHGAQTASLEVPQRSPSVDFMDGKLRHSTKETLQQCKAGSKF
jgi:hypothetical protein